MLEEFIGFVDQINEGEDKAFVTLTNDNESLYGEYSALKLQQLGIREHSHFKCWTEISDSQKVIVRFEPIPNLEITQKTIDSIHENMNRIFDDNLLDGDY